MKKDELHERLFTHFAKIRALATLGKHTSLSGAIMALDDDFDSLCEAINAVVYPLNENHGENKNTL